MDAHWRQGGICWSDMLGPLLLIPGGRERERKHWSVFNNPKPTKRFAQKDCRDVKDSYIYHRHVRVMKSVH